MAFCIECGQQLVDGAKFCFSCGKPVAQVQTETSNLVHNVKTQIVKSDKSLSKEFLLFNNQIIFDGNLVEIIKLQKLFLEFAWNKRSEFVELYDSIFTLEDLFDIGMSKFISSILESINLGVKTLMNYGIDYIDNNMLADLASEDFDLENIWSPIFNEVNKIQEEADRLSTFRDKQRASRGRWEGGGFGIRGAIKGALTAGAMNFATEAFHGIGDSLTNSSDKAKIENMKKNIVSSSNTLSTLSDGIYDSCFSVFYSVYEILYTEEVFVYEFEDMKIQNARLNNYLLLYREGELETNVLVKFICECIQIYPFTSNYYVELYKLGLPNRKDILPIAEFVGMKGEYQYRINAIDQLKISLIEEEMPEDTIPELENKISALEEILIENTHLDIDDLIDKYKKKIIELEEAKNTQDKIDKTIDLLQSNKTDIDNALLNSNLEFVWNEVNNGNVYAEYALEQYYFNLCSEYIKNLSVYNLNKILSEIKKYKNIGNVFSTYIINHILYEILDMDEIDEYDKTYFLSELDRMDTIKILFESDMKNTIIDIANNSNIVSAMTTVAIWGSDGDKDATPTRLDAINLLIECAELYHPKAMAYLGGYYRTGYYGIAIDLNLSKYYLTIASYLGDSYAKEELNKLNNDEKLKKLNNDNDDASSSLCYITTAVCTSFDKPDDCYELQLFRGFRDNWLKYQIDGEYLITRYYETAPKIVETIDLRDDSTIIYKYIWEKYLVKCLSFIELREFDKCKQLYISMVEDLKLKYL